MKRREFSSLQFIWLEETRDCFGCTHQSENLVIFFPLSITVRTLRYFSPPDFCRSSYLTKEKACHVLLQLLPLQSLLSSLLSEPAHLVRWIFGTTQFMVWYLTLELEFLWCLTLQKFWFKWSVTASVDGSSRLVYHECLGSFSVLECCRAVSLGKWKLGLSNALYPQESCHVICV